MTSTDGVGLQVEVADEIAQAIERAVAAGSYWTDARDFPRTAPVWEVLARHESERAATLLARFALRAQAGAAGSR